MNKISIIHPSRSRPEKSEKTISKWLKSADNRDQISLLVMCDSDDPELGKYKEIYSQREYLYQYEGSERYMKWAIPIFIGHKSRPNTSVAAINYGAELIMGETDSLVEMMIVVSDDTDCFPGWDTALLKEVEGKTDWILKTQDGIQPWIITFPILDRTYYNRTGYIYHPDFQHMFCDTWMSVMADVTGRRLTSNLLFPHLNDSIKDEVRKKTDATWAQGEKTFINLCKSLPQLDLRKIKDISMINWLRNKGVRI